MFDLVIVPTGHTFKRVCIEVCIQFNFTSHSLSSSHLDPSSLSFFLIPNDVIRDVITDFYNRVSMPHPSPLSPQSARALVQNLIDSDTKFKKQEDKAATAEAIDSTSKTLNQKYPS
ncbi:uncharacterized protein A4U43_C08F24830 [Asparagus officinalis]|nr:uncharacterized protein A4U43_C08F24830 [Asparagus officinalis]